MSHFASKDRQYDRLYLLDEALDQSETESDRELFLALPQDVVEELAEDRILPILTK